MPDPINNNGEPLLNQFALDQQFGGYIPQDTPTTIPNTPFKGLETPLPDLGGEPHDIKVDPLQSLENYIFSGPQTSGKLKGGSIMRSIDEVSSQRYQNFMPGDYNNEDAYGQTQGFGSKMVSGVGKGLLLTGTTFLEGTIGMLNGVGQMAATGRAASFYDNDFTRALDEINKKAEDLLPNYYTDVEKNANWYSPDKLFTGNFLWDGIVKNLGFAAGAMLAGNAYTLGLRSIPLTARLFSMGKAAEALAATEEGLATAINSTSTFGKVKSLSDKFIGSYNVLNPAGRAVVAGLGTLGEASFEAYQNLNDFRNNKIQEYKDLNGGEEPKGEALANINRLADSVGNSSFALNAALLSATNYIQFPKILGSTYKAEKGMINGLARETAEIVEEGGKFVAKEGKSKILKGINTVRPYLFSISEGFEEGAQFAISKGTEDYFNKKYNGKSGDIFDSLVKGVRDTLGSNEGMESIITGGLSGSIMTARGNYREGQEIKRNTVEAVESFNKNRLSDFSKETFDAVNRGVSIQEEREQYLKEGKVSESKDAEMDYIVNYLSPRIKFGRFDLVKQEIEDYRKLASSTDGFSQLIAEGKALVDDTQESYLKRINSLEQTANNVKSLYQSLNLRYGSQIDEEGKPIYSSAVMDKMVYAASKVADYDKRIPEVSASLAGLGMSVDDFINEVVSGELSEVDDKINNIVDTYIKPLKVIEDEKVTLAGQVEDIARMALKRDSYLQDYTNIKNNPKDNQEIEQEEADSTKTVTEEGELPEDTTPKETITIRTKNGDRDIELGTEYVLGKVVYHNANGKEVYRQPRLTVIGVNEDGSFKIKQSNGVIKDVTPEKLEDYSLTKASELLTNRKFKFFHEHQNSIFTNKLIKGADGKPVTGRLRYNTKDKRKLDFVYRDKNGKIKVMEAMNYMFKAQKDFKEPIINKIGELTIAQEEATKEFVAEKDPNIERRINQRFEILASLSDDMVQRVEKTNKLIEQKTKQIENKKQELDKISKEIVQSESDKRVKKFFKFKKAASDALKTAMELSRAVEQLQQEVELLQTEKEELEYNIQYIDNFVDELEDLPVPMKDLMEQLRFDRMLLVEAITDNNRAMTTITKLITSLEKAIDSAVSMLRGVLEAFGKKYEGVPSPNGQPWVDFLRETPLFLRDRPNYKEDFKQTEDYLAYVEDNEITLNENKITDLKEHMDIVSTELKELEKQLRAHDVILDKFRQISNDWKTQKREEQEQQLNETLKEEFIGVNDNSVQNVPVARDYEPASKKDNITLVTSTIVPATDKEFVQRADRFGVRFPKIPNNEDIKGMVVTSKTEAQLGLKGLTKFLATDPTTKEAIPGVNPDTTIALVFVKETADGPVLVDEFGDVLENPTLDNVIYQVFPLETLQADYGNGKESMFRETTPKDEVERLSSIYKGWRDTQLEKDSLGDYQDVRASFGILEYVTYTDTEGKEKRDYNSRIPVEKSGLIGDEDLEITPVVQVAISDTLSNGTSTFDNAAGKVFLRTDNGLVPLDNRKFNEREVDLIYDVMVQTAKNAVEHKTLKTEETQRFFTWLRSVAYWGTAKDQDGNLKDKPGYNNIWFDYATNEQGKSVTKLFISGMGYSVDYTPSALQRDQIVIKKLLSNLYFNTNASLVNSNKEDSRWNTPYFEIIGIDNAGLPITREWQNYQTFLLSPSQPNNKSEGKPVDKRDINDLPLTTNVRPLLGKEDKNRKAVYFTLTNEADEINVPQEEEVTEEPVKKPTQKPTQVRKAKPGEVVMDGKTFNTVELLETPFEYLIDRNDISDITNDDDIWDAIEFRLNSTYEDVANLINKKTGKNLDIANTKDNAIVEGSIRQKLIPIIKDLLAKQASSIVMDGHTLNTLKWGGVDFEYTLDRDAITDTSNIGLWNTKVIKWEDDTEMTSALEELTGATNAATGKSLKYSDSKDANFVVNSVMAKLGPMIRAELEKEEVVEDDFEEIKEEEEQEEDEEIEVIMTTTTPTVTPTEETTEEVEDQEVEDLDDWLKNLDFTAPDNENYRIAVQEESKFDITKEKWDEVEKFVKQSFPNIPFYRVKNIIKATNGRQAWGMLQDGAIYVYENAEVGTAYHEVFEAIWKMFTPVKERTKIYKEFKSREGVFQDRETGKIVPYKQANQHQIKEQLAEEFRDHILIGNAKPKSLIRRMFDELIAFIKHFFISKDAAYNTNRLFERVGNGYYAKYNPYQSKLSYANRGITDIEEIEAGPMAEYRVAGVPIVQLNEIIEHMTFATVRDALKDNKGLFNVVPENKKDLYNRLYKEVVGLMGWKASEYNKQREAATSKEKKDAALAEINRYRKLINSITENWKDVVEVHQNHLKAFDIQFDDNDDLNVTSDEKRKDDSYGDARQIDSFRKASSAVKILLGTLIEQQTVVQEGKTTNINKLTSIGGNSLIPGSKVFITLMNRLHDSVNIDDMLNRLRVIALTDPNYRSLYKRLTKSSADGSIREFKPVDYSVLDEHDFQLISAFWKTMKKQNADAVTVFVLPTGDIIVSDSTLTSAAKQSKRDMINNIIDTIKSDKSLLFDYNKKTGKYNPSSALTRMKLDPSKLETYSNFLKNLGVDFTKEDIKNLDPEQIKLFKENVEGMLESLSKVKDLALINTQTLNIDGRLFSMGTLKAFLENPEYESTYFNINGDRTQTYIGTNIVSSFYDVVSKLKNLNEVETNPSFSQYSYLKTDVFTKGSQILKKMFTDKGTRRAGTENLFRPVYIDGTINENNGKKKESSKLTYRERVIQEINLNLNGVFLNLVPGDASIEWGVKMFEKDSPFVGKEAVINKAYNTIFKNYLISEIGLARDKRTVAGKTDKIKAEKTKDLRFFKYILSPEVYTSVMKDVAGKGKTAEKIYDDYEAVINRDVEAFIKQDADKTISLLENYNILQYNEEGQISLDNIGLPNFDSRDTLMVSMKALSVNYMISNIEMHKLIYSDPYQYSDELKRIKNFNSPRQPLIAGSPLINASLHNAYNKDYRDARDIGYTDMQRDHFRTITIEDVNSINENEGYDKPYEETDGGGIITLKAYRVFRLRAGDWSDANERQYRYDIAYEKAVKRLEMSNAEKELYAKGNPGIKNTYTPLKPITAGNKANGRNYNDIVLHKFALVPQSFRILHQINPDSNAIKMYNKMQKEDVDYAVYASGSKVGSEVISPVYNEDGSFSKEPFQTAQQLKNPNVPQGVSRIPFAIVSVQSDVPSKDTPLVRQGTQITKLATMDFMEAGVPVDFMSDASFEERFATWNTLDETEKEKSSLYKEIKNNQRLLEAKIDEGYKTMLYKLGIKETPTGYKIADKAKLVTTLKDEVLKRDINNNIVEALSDLANDSVIIEATPVYQQLRNILFSIADKNVVSPKISGGMKVQITSAMLESNRVKAENVGDKKIFTSDILSFYKNEDGKRVCEVMVGRWFDSNMTDEELLHYLNETPEGQKVLGGVGFRIPTQKQNSIDVFKIKQFLPKDFGDSVVIPSALVKKAGSDFDIDKLSIYLKNVYRSFNGKPQIVPFYGIGQEAKDEFSSRFDRGEFFTKKQFDALQEEIDLFRQGKLEGKLVEAIFGDLGVFTEEDVLSDFIEELSEEGIKKTVVDSLYMKSLENAYIESLETLISSPENYDNLVKPNDASQLSNLAKKINSLLGRPEIDYSSPGNMLSRSFMSGLRQAFVSGKYAIGIAAVGQTGHAQRQRTPSFVNVDNMNNVPMEDREVLGANNMSSVYAKDTDINFQKYNKIKIDGVDRPALAMIKNKAGEYISDLNGMFIDGYVDISKGPWIMELGATPNVTSTWLFLIDLGVPINTIAYFMNQPIIKDYLASVENSGYSWLFIEPLIEESLAKFKPSKAIDIKGLPSEKELESTVGKTIEGDLELAQQQYILKEFLKYSKMANHQFLVTQGSNFDTATLNDPYLIYKKQIQYEKGRNTIISSIDTLAEASFIKVLKDNFVKVRNAMSTILLSDRDNKTEGRKSVRDVMEAVLFPYTEMNDRDFVKTSQKAVADLFDWAMQTNTKANKDIAAILVGTDKKKSAAREIIDFRNKVVKDTNHPLHSNIIINSLRLEAGAKEGKVDNLSLTAKDGKAYNQDIVISGFQELRDHLKANQSDLYKKLVSVAILQSGLTNSPIAFSQLLPYEDFKAEYNASLSILETLPNLEDYYNLAVFQRNNWNNSNIVPQHKAFLKELRKGAPYVNMNEAFVDKNLREAVKDGVIPRVINVQVGSQSGRSDFLVYQWENYITKEDKIKARKTGDYSYINRMLMKKVYTIEDGKRVPLVHYSNSKGKDYFNYVYRGINAWGDSFKAQEFYATNQESVLDNDFTKIPNEVDDNVIVNIMEGVTPEETIPDGLSKEEWDSLSEEEKTKIKEC